jgi:uncharacterized membrane protein YgcG
MTRAMKGLEPTTRALLFCMLLLVSLAAVPAEASERILEFHSDITVRQDATMTVVETIRVRAEGHRIRHGIYRDFPTDYRDRFGNRYRVGFHILRVSRDGERESYHTERRGNGVRIYIGDRDRYVEKGEHSYTLSYRTDRQLGYFADHDELYWNVTGNGWVFPIERAIATVHLPEAIPSARVDLVAYTGRQGAKGGDWRAWMEAGAARFVTTAPLGSHEGLTLVAAWPKGYVHEPDAHERLAWLLRDNRPWIAAGVGVLLLLGFYLVVWSQVGRDPPPGTLIPRYTPPDGYSPGSMRFVRRMGYDQKVFAVALVNLAVKGALELREEGGVFVARRTGKPVELAPGEQTLLRKLFGQGDTVRFEKKNHAVVGGALKAHRKALERNYEKVYFTTNSLWLLPGVLGTVALLGATVFLLPEPERRATAGFMTVWLSIWTVGVVALVGNAWKNWRAAGTGGSYGPAIFMSLFALPFLAGEAGGIWILSTQGSPALLLIVLDGIGINAVFYQLLKAPTRAGRHLLDRIEGFRLYLDVAEGDEIRLRSGPELTPGLFERYLPYAMALDLEARWSARFSAVFAELERRGQHYNPVWYHGSRWDSRRVDAFGAGLGGSLSAAIASSSTAPGSGSGTGGGGSSGGGGGGGGGGGW